MILAANPLFFPDLKKSSKFSLISLIGGNPVLIQKMAQRQLSYTDFMFLGPFTLS